MQITDKAYEKLLDRAKKRDCYNFRLALKPSGCAGFEYDFDFTPAPVGNTIEKGEISISIDLLSETFLQNVVLDYETKGLNEEFKFINPQETISCGCGYSIGF